MLTLVATLVIAQCPTEVQVAEQARRVEFASQDYESSRHAPGAVPGSLILERKFESLRLEREAQARLLTLRKRCLDEKERLARAERDRLAAQGLGSSRFELEAQADEDSLSRRCPSKDEVSLRRRKAEPHKVDAVDPQEAERAQWAWAAVRRAEAARERCASAWETQAAADPKERRVQLSTALCDAQGVLAGRPALGAPPRPAGAVEPPGSASAQDAIYQARSTVRSLEQELAKTGASPIGCATEPVKGLVACLASPLSPTCAAEPMEWRLRLYKKERRPGGGRVR